MLTLIVGEQGAGKTALAVRRALRLVEGPRPAARIFANFTIDHPNAERASLEEMSAPDFPQGICIWDEAARLLESRRSQSLPMSRLQSTTEERKHARDIILTAQMSSQIDVRVRHMCKTVTVLRPMFIVPRRYSPETDEITRREHPRLIVASSWRGKYADKLKPENRQTRTVLLWSQLAKYVDRYDTTESIAVAAHLSGRDFYQQQERATHVEESGPVVRSGRAAGGAAGRKPAAPRSPAPGARPRRPAGAVARPSADG